MNLSSLLFEDEKLPDRTLFWKMDDEIAIRQGPWKLVKIGDQPYELYNLNHDLGENKDLADEQLEIGKNLWGKYLNWAKEIDVSATKWGD